MSLAAQISMQVELEVCGVSNPAGWEHAILRDCKMPKTLAEERNIHEQKRYLWSMVNVQGLLGGPTTIYGIDGPVTYESMRDHPKNKPNQSRRWRSDKVITNS